MQSARPGAPPADARALDPRRQRAVILLLSIAALMVTYVETMIIPGIRNFESFFGQPLSQVQWILTAYLLVGVAFTPIAGKLGDIYGKKRILVLILAIYFVAVTFAGFTPNLGAAAGVSRPNQLYLLIGVRAVQGVGMAMFPLAFAMIGDEFPRERVAFAQGIVSAMFSVGATVGLLGGAAITQYFGWQLTYHTVIPVALGVLVVAIVSLAESRIRLAQPIDVPGSLFLALTLTFAILGMTQGPSWGWTTISAVSVAGVPIGSPLFFGLAVVFLVAFLVWERYVPRPVMDFRKLGERNILVANLVGLLAGMAMFMMFVALVAKAETPSAVGGLGLTPLDFGILSLPATVANIVLAPIVGRGIARTGPKPPMLIGSGLMLLGGAFLAAFNATPIELSLGAVPILVGAIQVFIAMTNMVVVSSKPQETGIQTGMNQTFRNLGTSVGPAIVSTILASFLATYTLGQTRFGPIQASAPSTGAYELAFGLVALIGLVSLLMSSFVRNFRFAADGRRVELGTFGPAGARGRREPGPAEPSISAGIPRP